MRCTKCSFISFDDLSACAKCSTDLSHLSRELNGTCIETRQEFFLGSAIQAPGFDEDILSDSQPLPPIDHSYMNFDDTNTGNFSPISPGSDASGPGFDDSVGFTAEDDVDIELGDIMPLDLDQLDSGFPLSDKTLGNTDVLSSSDLNIDLDHTSNLSDSNTGFEFDDNLSGDDIEISALSDQNSVDADAMQTSSFDSTLTGFPEGRFNEADFGLDKDLLGKLSDIDVDLDETVSLGADPSLNETQITRLTSAVGEFAPLELDESLVAELAGGASSDASGEFSGFSSDEDASGEFELDAALVAELADGGDSAVSGKDNLSIMNEVGDFPPLREDDDLEFAGLDLADIDVSDLVDKSAVVDNLEPEAVDGVLGLSLDHVAEVDDLELGVDTLVFDDDFETNLESKNRGGEDLPTIELVSDDEGDDVPPDIPA